MTELERDSERAWLRQLRQWEKDGIQPGAFTAFVTGYKIAMEQVEEMENIKKLDEESRWAATGF